MAKKNSTKWIPEGHHTVTPYLVVEGAAEFLSFMKLALGAIEVIKRASPDGEIIHGEVRIGSSIVMFGNASEKARPFPAMLHLYVEDVDALYQRAIESGAISIRDPENRPFGDRVSAVKDRWGNQWWIATHIEDTLLKKGNKARKDVTKM